MRYLLTSLLCVLWLAPLNGQEGGTQARLRETIHTLASVGSRISGYPGSEKASEYVYEQLVAAGVKGVKKEPFTIAVPVDKGASLTLHESGQTLTLYSVWPNVVRTTTLPPEGLEGGMVYGGKGDYVEFNGKAMDGRIVLMEFNSWDHWIQAASLGASAIVFIEPETTTNSQSWGKRSFAPLNVPRYWLAREAGLRLRRRLKDGGEIPVRLNSRMDWEEHTTWNIWGTVPGQNDSLKSETIIVQAPYDGYSIVPALAPAAEAAASVAGLLELARYLKEHPPARSVVLAATAAHYYQGTRGISEFLNRHARVHEHYAAKMTEPLNPNLFISISLSSKTDQLGIWNNTFSYDLKRFFVPFGRRYTAYAEAVAPSQGRSGEEAMVNGISPIKGMDWSTFVPRRVSVDSEFALDAGLVSLAFVTVNDGRFDMGTPLDTEEKVNTVNLGRQVDFLNGILSKSFNDPELFADLEDFGPVLKDNIRNIRIKLRSFPRRSQVPDRAVPKAVVAVDFDQYYITGADGMIEVPGIKTGEALITAFVLDPDTGAIIYAPDLSERATKHHGKPFATGHLTYKVRWADNEKLLVMFPSQERAFFNLIDSRSLKYLRTPKIIDRSGVAPRQFSFALAFSGQEGVIFGPKDAGPEDGLKILLGTSMLLINSEGGKSEEEARGKGYVLATDPLVPTEYLAVRDMWRLNDARLQTMRTHAIENQRLKRLHDDGGAMLAKAEEARAAKQWDLYVAYVRAALGLTSRAYPEVVGTLNDVIRGMVFFLGLLIPAAFFGERLLFAASDIRKQLAGFGFLLLVVWVILSQIHPAFAIAHPLIILLAFSIMAMAVFVLSMISTRFNFFMKEHKAKAAMIHETDISRVSAAYTAFMLGISNMRRRKLRTGLTLLTLTLLTFTVLSFTSFNQQVRFWAFDTGHEGRYEGVLIRDRGWNFLEFPTLDYARSHFEKSGLVAARNWYISIDAEQKKYIDISRGGKKYKSTGMLGLMARESRITGIDQALIQGSFFDSDDEETCLLSEEMAEVLGIGLEDLGQKSVQIFGRSLVVRGIFAGEAFEEVHDLDHEPLTPADFQLSSSQVLGPATQNDMKVTLDEDNLEIKPFVHLSAANVVVLPFETLREMGGTLRSVAIRFDQSGTSVALIEDFLLRLSITLFAGLRDIGEEEIKVFSYTSVGMTSVEGLGALVIPMFIAALIVLNAMLGAVYERFHEIGIYSSVGLAPLHISLLFIAEACVYAVIGVTLGYILGQGLGKVLIWVDFMQGMNLNYSSMSAIISALIVMLVVLLSTIYPARMAAQSAVPGTVRRWTPPPPDGDRWSFEFPFMVSEAEVRGVCGFLYNYFRAYSEESIGSFYAEKVRIVLADEADHQEYAVQMLLWLAPFDMGVSQYVQLEFVPGSIPGAYKVDIFLQRISGQDTFWQRVNQRFINGLRKEFLIWHSLKQEEKEGHRQTAEEVLMRIKS